MATIRQLITQLIFTTNTSGINQANNALNNFGRNARSAGNAANNMANSVASSAGKASAALNGMSNGVNALIGRLNAIAGAMAAAFSVDKIVETADEVMNLDGRLRTVTKTDEERYGLEDKLYTMAQSNRQEYSAIGDLYYKVQRGASRYGFNSDDSLRVADIVSKALTVGGASTQEAQATILQLGQALSSGTLQGDELHSLDENASLLMQHVADNLGVTIGQLKDLGKQGSLTTEVVMQAILASGEAIDGEFGKMPVTIGQAMTVVKNGFVYTVNEIERETHVFSTIAKLILDAFNIVSKAVKTFRSIWDGNADAIKAHPMLASFVNEVKYVVGELDKARGKVQDFLKLFGLAVDENAGKTATSGSFARMNGTGEIPEQTQVQKQGEQMGMSDNSISFVQRLAKFWNDVQQQVSFAAQTVKNLFEPAIRYVSDYIGGTFGPVFAFCRDTVMSGLELMAQSWQNLQPFIEAIMPLLSAIAGVIGQVLVWALYGLMTVGSIVFSAIAGFINWVTGLLGAMGRLIQWCADKLSSLIDKVKEYIGWKNKMDGLNTNVALGAVGYKGNDYTNVTFNQTNEFPSGYNVGEGIGIGTQQSSTFFDQF